MISGKIFYIWILCSFLLFLSCVLPPEQEYEPVKGNDASYALLQIYRTMMPGNKWTLISYLETVYIKYPDFAEGEEIMGWINYLNNDTKSALDYWQKSNPSHLDLQAGMMFYNADQLNSAKVIEYGENILQQSPEWHLGETTLRNYGVQYYNQSFPINHFDIRVLLAEAYFVTGRLEDSLTMVKSVDTTIHLQPDDPELANKLAPIIARLIEFYVLFH